MVFVEFTSKNGKHYFVGTSYKKIMADTNNGKKFGFILFSSHREIIEKEARSLNLGFLEEAIESIKMGHTNSFKLSTPK